MKLFLCLMMMSSSTGLYAAWTTPHGMTPVKQEVIKPEVRHPASHVPVKEKEQTKKQAKL